MYLSNFKICEDLASILRNDLSFQEIAKNKYGKEWTVQVGFDSDKQDWNEISPFVVILPSTEESNSQGVSEYRVEILLGIFEKDNEIENPAELGFEFISKLALPLVFSNSENAADKNSLYFDRYTAEFDQENFPLMYADIFLTFLKQSPIGGRRF